MKQKRIIITLAIAIPLIIGAGLAVWFTSTASRSTANTPSSASTQDSDSVDYNPPTPEQVSAGDTTKQDTINTNQAQPQTDSSTPVPIVTSAKSVTSERVSLRFMIEGVHEGSCSITLTGPSGAVVSKTAPTQPLASTTTCQGFDILTSELSTGKWSFVLNGSFENERKGQVTGEFSL